MTLIEARIRMLQVQHNEIVSIMRELNERYDRGEDTRDDYEVAGFIRQRNEELKTELLQAQAPDGEDVVPWGTVVPGKFAEG